MQFDPDQKFQLQAVASVVDLFEGQPQGAPEYAVIKLAAMEGLFAAQERSALGIGNRLLVGEDKLLENLRKIQTRHDIEIENPEAPMASWELFDAPANRARSCPHFSVEMETGTGKTYVYLRTIFELSVRYGFQKFIIVVPSVAIREGVLKNIEITSEHFRSLYGNPPFEYSVYDGKKVNRLRQFAVGNHLQILIINIDAFRKNFTGTEAEQRSNVIYKESDRLNGRPPIEFVQAARPIVIIDEPQSVDSTEKAQEAIKALNPLCTLRYSATHRDLYNLVYRLDPVRAFELKLVKQIVVGSAAAEGVLNAPFIRVEAVDYKKGIKAKLRIHVQGPDGPKEKLCTVKQGSDLFALSEERAEYQALYEVAEINAEPGNEYVRFSGGLRLRLGEETGGMKEEVWKAQIKHTIQRHLEKELQLKGRGIKVLSLFFIDRVANYRQYLEGQSVPGKFAQVFEAELRAFAQDPRYRDLEWLKFPLDKLHNGYFAQDNKGKLKDTRGDTQADDEVYNLIMKDKELLLALEEPLRFIFSHSALREGWDNPNVFQICTLNETKSGIKKRQEIGRGLRLPVDQEGRRVFDDVVNRLYVMANESYEDFAKGLQKEYEEDCGVTFGRVPLTAFAKLTKVVEGQESPLGKETGAILRKALIDQGLLDQEGRIQPAFEPAAKGFQMNLPEEYRDLVPAVIDLLSSYRIERHIRKEREERPNHLKKEVVLGPAFQALWERIKAKTTYRVEFDTEELVHRAVGAIRRMEKVERPRITVMAGKLEMAKGGVVASVVSVAEERVDPLAFAFPDILAYLQNETELTRSTLARILVSSGRLDEAFLNPQCFMDAVASVIKHELHRLLVDGVKYERIQVPGLSAEYEMKIFENQELVDYLNAVQVEKSIYDYVPYDSEVEREFAKGLDAREDIKLFVKLPRGFEIDTPVGKYVPDWAIVKQNGEAIYLVRETKATKDFLKLRNVEADKVKCGKKHFEAVGIPFDVAVTADDVR